MPTNKVLAGNKALNTSGARELDQKQQRGFVVAAPHSGSGKTTIAALLCLALRERGLGVQPFKLGPDYLDPTYLSRAAGRPARNLDNFLLPSACMVKLFARASASADVSVVEGVMGLFDGRGPLSNAHSTAELAASLDLPVVLVIDASGMARTVAAIATGLRDFCQAGDGRAVRLAGVILNRVGSAGHAELCAAALAQAGIVTLGFVLNNDALHLPSRHLGLLAAEQAEVDKTAALEATRHLDLDALLAATLRSHTAPAAAPHFPTPRTCIAYALDEAFSFYYPDALDELRLAGAKLVPFSPLRDMALPPGCTGLLIGGGYPEAHAGALAANVAMRRSVSEFAAQGFPVVAECGGLMYLCESLEDLQGHTYPMCGVVPYRARMQPRLCLGYREATALRGTPLAPAGTALRGHEFHYSALAHPPTRPAYRWQLRGGEWAEEGYAAGNILASYLHVHLAADPALARRFVQLCASVEAP